MQRRILRRLRAPSLALMTTQFNNQLVFITGGSSGIGLALMKQFAARGANVWIAARRIDQLQDAQAQIRAACQNADQTVGILQLDVADRTQIAAVAAELLQKAGTPDYVINSAGVVQPGEFLQLKPEHFEWMMDINYLGTVFVTRALLPAMLKRGSGHLINISSSAGFVGVYGYTGYSGSKFAVKGFTDALRSEIKNCGITVSLVCPADTETPQLEYDDLYKPPITRELSKSTGRMKADQAAEIILRGIERRRYLIIPGLMNRLTYIASNLLGAAWYPFMDWMVRDARRAVGAANDKACQSDLNDPDQV